MEWQGGGSGEDIRGHRGQGGFGCGKYPSHCGHLVAGLVGDAVRLQQSSIQVRQMQALHMLDQQLDGVNLKVHM